MVDAASLEAKLIFQRIIKKKASKIFVLIRESEFMYFKKLRESRYKMGNRYDRNDDIVLKALSLSQSHDF